MDSIEKTKINRIFNRAIFLLLRFKGLRKVIFLLFRRKYRFTQKINLCSGLVRIKGYANLDKWLTADIVYDVNFPLPFYDNSIERIVMMHAIYYFEYEKAKEIISEIYRILKSDGIVRLSFTDLSIFAKKYIEKDYSFYCQKIGTGEDRFKGKTIGDKFISHAYFYGGIKYFYDFESLKVHFEEAGFREIKRCNFKESQIENIEEIDNRPELSGFLEAKK